MDLASIGIMRAEIEHTPGYAQLRNAINEEMLINIALRDQLIF